MAILEAAVEAVELLISGYTPLIIILGIILGVIFGALPGIGASLGMAILLPLTLPMEGLDAIILLVSIYSGAMYGGSIAAILINAPGTAAAAATTFDGYPMTRQGEGKTALAISATSSAFGGTLSIIILLLMTPILITLILQFGSPEYFLIALLGISMITVVSRGSMVKGIVAGFFGLALTTIGVAPMNPTSRYTFDSFALSDGISFIAALIGLFAISEMLKLAAEHGGISKKAVEVSGRVGEGVKIALAHPVLLVKSGLIGMGIGSIPGAGASVSNFLAYGEALRSSKSSKTFGEGNPEGVIASESSNNATIAGSLIPTLAFGIPGSASTAVLVGGLLMHGLRPGPDLFQEQLPVTYTLLFALLIGNLLIVVFGLLFVTKASYLTQIDTNIIIPVIIVLSIVGAYSLRTNWIDIITVLVLGLMGFYMKKHNYSIIAFVLGIVLGPIAEDNLHRSLQLSGGSLDIFVTRPLSLLIVIAIVLITFGPSAKPYFDQVRSRI